MSKNSHIHFYLCLSHLKHFLLIVPFVLLSTIHAAIPLWSWEQDISLEKEQTYQATFQVGDVQKELVLRWTLYKNYALVLHIRYDKFNHQVMLYTDYQRNSYKIELGNQNEVRKPTPHLVMFFKEFDNKEGIAHLKLYIEGQNASVLDERISPSKKKAQNTDSNQTLESATQDEVNQGGE